MSALMPIFQSLCEGSGWSTFSDLIGKKSPFLNTHNNGEKENEGAGRWRGKQYLAISKARQTK
jgi:hypothetical protein